jgi:hypothetical protein
MGSRGSPQTMCLEDRRLPEQSEVYVVHEVDDWRTRSEAIEGRLYLTHMGPFLPKVSEWDDRAARHDDNMVMDADFGNLNSGRP